MLTQENVIFDAVTGMQKIKPTDRIETFLSFLPLSHILERTAGYYAALIHGHHIAFAENIQKVMENMVEVKPLQDKITDPARQSKEDSIMEKRRHPRNIKSDFANIKVFGSYQGGGIHVFQFFTDRHDFWIPQGYETFRKAGNFFSA